MTKIVIIIIVVLFLVTMYAVTPIAAAGDKVHGDNADGPAYQAGECPFGDETAGENNPGIGPRK